MSVRPSLVTVNTAKSPSVTSISLMLYVILGSLVSVPGKGTPPIKSTFVTSNGFPVNASSQTYCV